MIVVVLVIGGWLGWIGRGAHIQHEAVAAITSVGGKVGHDWEWRDGTRISGGRPPAPAWVVNLIGVDCFGHVDSVRLNRSSRGDVDYTIEHIEHLTEVQVLYLFDTPISDSDLLRFKGLNDLRQVFLSGAQITDAGLGHLKGLTNLSYLGLGGTRVTDAGLAHLKGLTNLTRLVLSNTQVTDAGVRELQQALPSLKILR
jgi:Leucine Rich repeat